MEQRLLTTEEVAEYLRVEVVTVRRLVTRGELPAYRIGGEFRFMIPDIQDFVKSQRVAPVDASFDKFTERMRKVLTLANEEAAELSHHYIGTEHLLLGLVREGEGVGAMALLRSGLDFKDVRRYTMNIIEKAAQGATEGPAALVKAAVQGALGAGRASTSSGVRGLTARAKKVLELGVDEARRLGHHSIGTEHLLLGILREGERDGGGLAAQVLIGEYKLQLNQVRDLILQILQEAHTISPPEIPEQAATLLGENEQGKQCSRCGAHSPEYFRYCFHCGLKFP
jgi:excisionase family DNA binding protein